MGQVRGGRLPGNLQPPTMFALYPKGTGSKKDKSGLPIVLTPSEKLSLRQLSLSWCLLIADQGSKISVGLTGSWRPG